MCKWMVACMTDILLALLVVTVLLGYGAYHYPDFFPRQFFRYWTLAAPATLPSPAAPLAASSPLFTLAAQPAVPARVGLETVRQR